MIKSFNFRYRIEIGLELTREQIAHLISCTQRHYDGTCKAAGDCGGFIFGWRNQLYDTDSGIFYCTFRELDLLTKILEADENRSSFVKEINKIAHRAGIASNTINNLKDVLNGTTEI